MWKTLGCQHCLMTGAKGRIGLFELLRVDPSLREVFEHGATLQELEENTTPDIYISMRRYAKHLMEQGLASPPDFLHVFPGVSAFNTIKY
jgi:general secretion pathway protein E